MEYYIYLIRQGDSNYYKIGMSKNPKNRLKDFQVASPQKLTLKHISECENAEPNQQEASLHKKFKEYHVRGEWYRFNENQISWVINILDTHSTEKHRKKMEKIFRGMLPYILRTHDIIIDLGKKDVSIVKKREKYNAV